MWRSKRSEEKGLRIDSSNIGMESARSYRASNTTTRRFSIMDYRQGSLTNNGNALNAAIADGQNQNGQVQEGQNKEGQKEDASAKKLYTVEDWLNQINALVTRRVGVRGSENSRVLDNLRQMTVRYIFELLFSSRRNKVGDRMSGNESGGGDDAGAAGGNGAANTANGSANSGNQGWQGVSGLFATNMKVLSYSQESTRYEQENTTFSTVGTVRTSDGREINFNVDIGMSRQFQQTFQQDLQLASFQMCDPLVINLDTDVAELSDQKFFFDIDADGTLDEVSQLNGKSGYLALDKNGDGIINDGSELFGTASGDGFADLAKYDEDGNGWIDENDAVWSKLKIWCKDADGKDVLYRLADKGVGAICLQRAATDFTLQGAQGQTNGAIRSTGVFLYENGNVGTVQHVDVARYEQGA